MLANPVVFIDPDGKDVLIAFKNQETGKKDVFNYVPGTVLPKGASKFLSQTVKALDDIVSRQSSLDKGLRDVMNIVENKNEIVNIKESKKSDFNGKSNNQIRFNTTLAVQVENLINGQFVLGDIFSPSEVLEHEFGHAANKIKNPKKFKEDRESGGKREIVDGKTVVIFVDAEEQQNVEKIDNRNDKFRNTEIGVPKVVDDVLSTTPVN